MGQNIRIFRLEAVELWKATAPRMKKELIIIVPVSPRR
jgi:hypothetical protein